MNKVSLNYIFFGFKKKNGGAAVARMALLQWATWACLPVGLGIGSTQILSHLCNIKSENGTLMSFEP